MNDSNDLEIDRVWLILGANPRSESRRWILYTAKVLCFKKLSAVVIGLSHDAVFSP
jgi:hypothetical protein